MSESLRIFFALWPPDTLSRELYRIGGDVLSGTSGRRVVPENIHLTLAFLGSVNATFRDCAESAASRVRADPFVLELDQIGCWPKSGILWIGPGQVPDALIQLVRSLTQELTGCGYQAECRPYAAHLTLARNVRPCTREYSIESRSWEIDRFSLVQSRTHREGACYETLREWKLGKAGR